ncbi:MAG: ABC transporter permease [Spirochaetales bacterium]|nr:ABC transporter permease [Spirochaetales bacterium]
MNGATRKLLLVARISLLRDLRQPASTIVMLGIPLVLIPIMGAVFSKIPSWDAFMDGAPDPMAFFAIGVVVMFQLFGGRFSMEAVRESLLSEKKWRIHSAPCPPAVHAMGIISASTLLSLLQGFLLVAFARAALGVRWGSPAVVFLALLGASLVSQLVHVIILLLIRNYGAAISVGWAFAWGSAALGGLIFPVPQDRPFWHFMATYGTPYSLAQSAVVTSAGGGPWAEVATDIGLLFALSAALALVLFLLGRRKLG